MTDNKHPLDGETVTLKRVTWASRFRLTVWNAEGLFFDPTFNREMVCTFSIYGEHERIFKAAGYTAFNRQDTQDIGAIDVTLQWDDKFGGLRPVGVFDVHGKLFTLDDIGGKLSRPMANPAIRDVIEDWPALYKGLAKRYSVDIVPGCEWLCIPVYGALMPSLKTQGYKPTKFVTQWIRDKKLGLLSTPTTENESENAA